MKKIFTLAALAATALTVNAQSQVGNFKESAASLVETESHDPVTLAATANVTASFPFKDDENAQGKGYKAGHIKCDNEAYVVVSDFEGNKYIIDGNGATGNGNPRTTVDGTTSISAEYPYTTPARGVVFQFEIGSDLEYDAYATLVVAGKFGDNKNFLVYEGDNAISYTLVVASKDFETPSVQKNYYIDEEKIKGASGKLTGNVLGEGTKCDWIDNYYGITTPSKKSGTGVIFFPVVKGRTYRVCGLGTKIVCSGYALLCDDDPANVELIRTKTEGEGDAAVTSQDQSIFLVKDYEITAGGYENFVTTLEECKAGETAVAGVAEAKAEVAAPAKVVKNGQIFIGNYTVAGAQVK